MFASFSKTKIAKKTFIFDSCRCFCSGIIEAGFNVFALLIAIRVFHASKFAKSLLTSAWFAGYLIDPITQALAARAKHMRSMDISKWYMLGVSAIVLFSVFTNSLTLFLILMMAAMMLFKQPAALMADVYGQNYSPKERGSRLAFVLMILPVATVVFSPIGGKLMDINLQYYRWILLVVALAAVGSAFSFSKIPSRAIPPNKGRSIFTNFKIIFEDKLFGLMLLWWTFAGVANQMTKPLKTEYLVNSVYGVNASNLFETLACVTIPFGFRLISSLMWGKFFDKLRIVTVKLAINTLLMFGFLLFFYSKNRLLISFASMLLGLAYGGGEILWCLWVTKIAPKDRFSAYMSANVAVVGIRGFFSPFLGYSLSHYLTLQQISWVAALLIFISTAGFFSLRNHPRFSQANEV